MTELWGRQAAVLRAHVPSVIASSPPAEEIDYQCDHAATLDRISHYGSIAIILGWGDGSLIRDIAHSQDQAIKQKVFYVIIFAGEEDAVNRSLLTNLFCGEDSSVGLWFNVAPAIEPQDALQHVHFMTASHQQIPALAGCDIIDNHTIAEGARQLRKEFTTILRRELEGVLGLPGNCFYDSYVGWKQETLNLPRLLHKPNMVDLRGIVGTAPVICIGSGPSVEDHLDELRDLQDKAYLIAAESAVKSLLENGIEPDMTTPIERVPQTVDFCRCCEGTNVFFAGIPVVPPETLDFFDDRLLMISHSGKLSDWYDPNNVIDRLWAGHSTGMASLVLASWLSAGDIYLVGHDLAYRDGKSHWTSVANYEDDNDRAYYCGETAETMGNSGKMVSTTKIWQQLIRQITTNNMMRVNTWKLPPFISVMAEDNQGALLRGLRKGPLPTGLTKMDKIDWRACGTGSKGRMKYWSRCVQTLPGDWDIAVQRQRMTYEAVERMGINPNLTFAQECYQMAQATSIIAGVSKPNRPVFNYIGHTMLYMAAMGCHYGRRRAKTPYDVQAAINKTMLTLTHDFGYLLNLYEQDALQTCQQAYNQTLEVIGE